MRRWGGTSPLMLQPPLDRQYLVMHLGGPKRVARRAGGVAQSSIVDAGSITMVPAGTSYAWHTSGPIAFAHLYFTPAQLGDAASSLFDVDGATSRLVDRVGRRDPLLEPLFLRMLAEIERPALASPLLLDELFENVLARLARHHASHRPRRTGAVTLAPHRLRRVVDFIDAHLADPLSLSDLAAVAGMSAFHFSHAFRAATGCPPYRYLLDRRIDLARTLLLSGDETIETIAARSGFRSRRQLGVMFKRTHGTSPGCWRRVKR